MKFSAPTGAGDPKLEGSCSSRRDAGRCGGRRGRRRCRRRRRPRPRRRARRSSSGTTRPVPRSSRSTRQTHPHANIKWVLYSGDSNGDGTLQSKFALYNRVGWKAGVAPDVVFDEENYEAGWLGEPPFNDLLNLTQYIPKSVWSKDEGLGDCLINGKLLCLRNDNAANVLWVNTKLWSQFFPGSRLRPRGSSTPPTVSRWSRTIPATSSASSASRGMPRPTCGATSARSTRRSATRSSWTTRARRTARRSRS